MEVAKIDTKIAKAFKINILEVQDMVKEYQKMTLIQDDEDSYKICRVALTSCIRTRTGIDKRRLELNSKAQNEIKGRNAAAKQLAAIIAPAEDHLTGLVKGEDSRIQAIEDEEERLEREKIDKRVNDLAEYRCILPFMEVSTMTDEEFEAVLTREKEAYEAEQARLAEEEVARKAEDERLAKQKTEQEAREVALKKQAKEIAVQQKIIEDEKDRIAKEEADRIQSKKDAEEKVKREAEIKEREAKYAEEMKGHEAEEKKRQESLKPIKERIYDYANDILKETPPTFEDPQAVILIRWAVAELVFLSDRIKTNADNL